jgi:hypothetical protein
MILGTLACTFILIPTLWTGSHPLNLIGHWTLHHSRAISDHQKEATGLVIYPCTLIGQLSLHFHWSTASDPLEFTSSRTSNTHTIGGNGT